MVGIWKLRKCMKEVFVVDRLRRLYLFRVGINCYFWELFFYFGDDRVYLRIFELGSEVVNVGKVNWGGKCFRVRERGFLR